MKRIGLLGGTAWPSTIEYYRIINEMAQFHYGSSHSAKVILWSIDYHEIRQHYPDDWSSIDLILKRELLDFSDTNPCCILICNNTLHESYDSIKDSLDLAVPVIHMADLTVAKARESGMEHVLLLGTKYTMEKGYYSAKFESSGITVSIPTPDERIEIQAIQQYLANGEAPSSYKARTSHILSNYAHCDAVVSACTELPLVVSTETTSLEILDPMRIQCEEGFKYAALQ